MNISKEIKISFNSNIIVSIHKMNFYLYMYIYYMYIYVIFLY